MSQPSVDTGTSPGAAPDKNSDLKHRVIAAVAGPYRMAPVMGVLLVIWIFFATQSPLFLTSENLANLVLQIVVTAALAMGLVFMLLVGEIDLSVANLSAVAAAIAANLIVRHDMSAIFGVAVALMCGAAWGLMQGYLVTKFKVPAFLLTLATSLVLQGLLLRFLPPDNSQIPLFGTPLEKITGAYLTVGSGYAVAVLGTVAYALYRLSGYQESRQLDDGPSVGRSVGVPVAIVGVASLVFVAVLNNARGVPIIIVVMFALLGILSTVLKQTKFGTALYAIGGNAEAARRSGINVTRIRLAAFMFTGTFAAVGGLIAASRTLSVSNQSASDTTMLLNAIAAAVIGGTSLLGGRGSIWSALVGALVIGSIANGLYLLDASTTTRLVIQGGVLALAICLDAMIVRAGNKNEGT